MTIYLNNIINEIITLIENDDLEAAKSKALKISESNKSNDVLFNLLGIINLKLKNYPQAIKNFKNAIKVNNNFISAIVNLAICFQTMGQIDDAIVEYKNALKISPGMYKILNDIALLYLEKNEIKLSIKYLQDCIRMKPDFYNAYFNLGTIYIKIKDYKKAILNLEKSLKINPNFHESYFELAESNRKLQNYENAIYYYNKSINEKTSYKKLQCYYEEGNKNKYSDELQKIIKIDPNNRRIASLTAFVSNQINIKNIYPFCSDPLNFVYKSSIDQYCNNKDKFIDTLLLELSSINFKWEPKGRTTVKGFATKNLTDKNLPNFKKIEEIIFKELENYYNYFSNKTDNVIKNKPEKYKFVSWSNRLKKEGFNLPHIHPSGWISGVFYLKVPSKIKNNEAGIQFHLNGDDFIIKNENLPIKTVKPQAGDIVLFPSSLFHSTVPFNSSEERICIAFDLCNLSKN